MLLVDRSDGGRDPDPEPARGHELAVLELKEALHSALAELPRDERSGPSCSPAPDADSASARTCASTSRCSRQRPGAPAHRHRALQPDRAGAGGHAQAGRSPRSTAWPPAPAPGWRSPATSASRPSAAGFLLAFANVGLTLDSGVVLDAAAADRVGARDRAGAARRADHGRGRAGDGAGQRGRRARDGCCPPRRSWPPAWLPGRRAAYAAIKESIASRRGTASLADALAKEGELQADCGATRGPPATRQRVRRQAEAGFHRRIGALRADRAPAAAAGGR